MSKDSEVRKVAIELEDILARLRAAADALTAVLVPLPDADPGSEQVTT